MEQVPPSRPLGPRLRWRHRATAQWPDLQSGSPAIARDLPSATGAPSSCSGDGFIPRGRESHLADHSAGGCAGATARLRDGRRLELWIAAACRPSSDVFGGREWQAEGQSRSVWAGRLEKAGQQNLALRGKSAHLGIRTGGIIEIGVELLRPSGRKAAAAPSAAALCQEPRRFALSAANRAAPATPAGPPCAGKVGRAAPSSLEAQIALRSATRACCLLLVTK
eukprot:scaffold3540_cov147-Isochrysis_galbana.AAC.8